METYEKKTVLRFIQLMKLQKKYKTCRSEELKTLDYASRFDAWEQMMEGIRENIPMITISDDKEELPLFCEKLYGGGIATCYRKTIIK